MANNYFQFKAFRIEQNKAAMKVGTDGVLLGAWANCSSANSILDIGTGTGLIALMLAQRSDAEIIGIDIDNNAIDDAIFNINASKWSDRISLHHSSLQEFTKTSDKKFDLIVSNPPFFENSLKTPNASRTLARHTDSLDYSALLLHTSEILHKTGVANFIIPCDAFNSFKDIAANNGLFLNRLLWIKPTPNKMPKRVLVEFSKKAKPLTEETLIIEEFGRHQYSQAYIDLTKDFYLNM